VRLKSAYTLVLAAALTFLPVVCLAEDAKGVPPEPLSQTSIPAHPAGLGSWSVLPGVTPAKVPQEEQGGQKGALSGSDYFSLGEESYEVGDYARAKDYYIKAIGLIKDTGRIAKAHERLAFIYAAFGETDKVHGEFVEALKLDRDITLDPDLVSPKVYEEFVKARDEVVREGVLVVNCDPAGAEVYLDGKQVGEAPARLERVEEGEYSLRLVKAGFETIEDKVAIKKDVTLTVDEKMVKARGSLRVDSAPPGVQLVLDGRAAGVTPLTIENVSGGEHSLSFKREYFDPLEATVKMDKGEAASYTAELKRRVMLITPDGTGGADGLVVSRLSGIKGISLVKETPEALRERLTERGLDPASLGFMFERKTSLTLEDAAALSGIMEDDGAELAIVAVVNKDKDGLELGLALYSTASLHGDSLTYQAKDEDALGAGLDRFAALWEAVADPYRPSEGLRLVDREPGGAEVISATPGWPASSAGLTARDIIRSVDGKDVAGKADFIDFMSTPGEHEISYIRAGSAKNVKLSQGVTPVETPLGEPGYLYNLALVESAGYIENVPEPKDGSVDDRRGVAALDLGNVYRMTGEYDKAVDAYKKSAMTAGAGICTGTALYRLGGAYERLGMWTEAADAYRRAMILYPDAAIGTAEGQPVKPLALERLKWLFNMGLTKERWWL
jgi:tetratricopeptide (TPR) repeat protein